MPVDSTERFILINAVIMFGAGVWLSFANHDYFQYVYTAEDGLLEWLTVFALGAIALILAGRLWVHRRFLGWRQRLVLGGVAVLAVFGAGEELSWGQRLLGIDSSDFFLNHNKQKEINIHNLSIGDVSFNKDVFSKGILLVFSLYVFVVTPMYHRFDVVRRLCNGWGIPIPQRYQYLGYLITIVIVEGLLNMATDPAPRRGELTEFMITILAALNLIYPLNQGDYLPKLVGAPSENADDRPR